MITTKFEEGFPNVYTHTTSRSIIKHKSFEQAKNGNIDTAIHLVSDLLKIKRVLELAKLYPDAKLVPIIGLDDTNKIPLAYVSALNAVSGLEIESGIKKINITSHTNKTALERLLSRAKYSGNVQKGKLYIIADDVITQGGSLNELRNYIQENGGRVVAATTLGFTQYSTQLAMQMNMIEKIEREFGRYETEKLIKEIGVGNTIENLTNSEGRFILSHSSIDTIRNRILELTDRNRSQVHEREIQENIKWENRNMISKDIREKPGIAGRIAIAKGKAALQNTEIIRKEIPREW